MKTGDSSNWTSLSIWINRLTVISRSALCFERHQLVEQERPKARKTHNICRREYACSYA